MCVLKGDTPGTLRLDFGQVPAGSGSAYLHPGSSRHMNLGKGKKNGKRHSRLDPSEVCAAPAVGQSIWLEFSLISRWPKLTRKAPPPLPKRYYCHGSDAQKGT